MNNLVFGLADSGNSIPVKVDEDGVVAVSGGLSAGYTLGSAATAEATLTAGSVTVPVPGTPVPLSSTPGSLVASVVITAKPGNTNRITAGGQSLAAGDSLTITPPLGRAVDLNKINVNAITAGEGVDYLAVA